MGHVAALVTGSAGEEVVRASLVTTENQSPVDEADERLICRYFHKKIRTYMNSEAALRWKYGGRKVCEATSQRGLKMRKSASGVPIS